LDLLLEVHGCDAYHSVPEIDVVEFVEVFDHSVCDVGGRKTEELLGVVNLHFLGDGGSDLADLLHPLHRLLGPAVPSPPDGYHILEVVVLVLGLELAVLEVVHEVVVNVLVEFDLLGCGGMLELAALVVD
jgi:hypothetical protein